MKEFQSAIKNKQAGALNNFELFFVFLFQFRLLATKTFVLGHFFIEHFNNLRNSVLENYSIYVENFIKNTFCFNILYMDN